MKFKINSVYKKVSKKLKEKDFFKDSFFSDEKHTWSVEEVLSFAKDKTKPKKISLDKLENQRKYWQGNKERMLKSDTSFPLLILVEPNGELSLADGLNRLEKAVTVENKSFLFAYILDKKDIMHLARDKK